MTNGNGDKTDIIEKVRKLLRLAGSANEHEAALAAEKAQALLAKHNLAIGEVDFNETKSEKFSIDGALRMHSFPWRRQLANAVAKLYFCSYFFVHHRNPGGNARSGHDAHHFVGAEHNIGIAKLMFEYLANTVDHLARQGANLQSGSKSSYITSFCNAASSRLYWRIQARIEDAKAGKVKDVDTGSNLPALLDLYDSTQKKLQDFLAANVGPMASRKDRMSSKSFAGDRDGRAAGDRIGLDPQVRGAGNHKAIARH